MFMSNLSFPFQAGKYFRNVTSLQGMIRIAVADPGMGAMDNVLQSCK